MGEPVPVLSDHDAKPLIKALQGEKTDRVPFWFMRQAGRYLPEYRELRVQAKDFLTLCYTPEWAVEVTMQPIRRFGMDAAILFSDILVIPDALGMRVRFEEGHGPVLDRLESQEDLARLNWDRFETTLKPVIETVSGLREALPAGTALIGFSGAPWTLAAYMIEGGGSREFLKARQWASLQHDNFTRLIAMLEEAIIRYLGWQIEAGAEVVQLFDSWAGVLHPSGFEDWVIRPTERIVRALKKKYPHIPVIGFPKGAGLSLMSYARVTGVHGVSVDYATPMHELARHLPRDVIAQGNLDPVWLLGEKQDLLAAAESILSRMEGTSFIFNLGHGITPETPPENMAALCDFLREWKPA